MGMNYGAHEVGKWSPTPSSRSSRESRPISETLFNDHEVSFAAVAPLPSNVEAIEAALQFVAGATVQAVIAGPSGTGKTHLLEAVVSVGTRTMGAPLEIVSTEAFLDSRRALDTAGPVVLDDVQVALGRPRMRQDLRRVLETRCRRGKPTIAAFTIDPGPMGALGIRAIQGLIPSPRSWTIATLGEPTRGERPALLAHLARTEGLRLSSALSTVLAREMGGNGHTVVGAMRRLRLEGADWTTSRRTLRGLGLLDPYFNDNSAWDLRHLILREAERHRVRFAQFLPIDLALYTMLHEARLCERAVAQYVGREPAAVYGLAARFGRALSEDPAGRARVDEFVGLIVDSLIR